MATHTHSAETATDNESVSRRIIEEGFNKGNLGIADELIAPDAVDHDPTTPPHLRNLRGPELFRQAVSMYRSAFPDLQITVEDTISQGDKVVLRWRSEGTHRGELMGLAPTNTKGSVTGITIDRFENGKVVETWTEWDNLGLARQIGAAPPEGSRAERFGALMQRLMARRMRKRSGVA
jgi:steroid delta-isomerase-like uncharacterized protein